MTEKLFNIPDFRVLFISQTARVDAPYLDPSVRYRCYNPAEEFVKCNVIADIVAQQRLTLEMLDNYDAFIFHRPYGGDEKLELFVEKIRSQNKFLMADYDDLIFAPKYALHSSIYINKVRTEMQTKAIFNANYKGLCFFDYFSVSTEPLKQQILELRPDANVFVIPNGLSVKLLQSLDIKQNETTDSPLKVISYLSGTASHNKDFAFVASALSCFLNEKKEYRLGVFGPLEIEEGVISPFSLIRFPHKNYREFLSSISRTYINIAPLAPNNIFNECKSGLKFFESGIWGVPTIASPISDFKRFSDSAGLLLAHDENEWTLCLQKLSDPAFYSEATKSLREYCLENCLATQPALTLLNHLNMAR